ncbi:hypothetical protein [Pseudofrankia sp. BMG5.37]|uniref:hypothetical protein n=1 Tax=Pseudofrankia sp. BMG5.37 TaxID=3050035 RepID=UPI0028957974|nr:hypothetical protein [Pseudofrankia sp. BMG5.37]MDT3441839.1 hypothetical protein [Pseudofrankia sp. BMG5.37]
MIFSVHARTLQADLDAAGALLDGLSSDDDRLWPSDRWPAQRLDRPLGQGATGGHGPIRYTVEAYQPGRAVTFRFDPSVGLRGTHAFEVSATGPGTVEFRHELTGRPTGAMRLGWPLVWSHLHDALVEDALDNAERILTGAVARPATYSRRVRLLRAQMRRTGRRRTRTVPQAPSATLSGQHR